MAIAAIVVDDDLGSASAIGRLLEQAQCRVTICTNPETAIGLALNSGVDVVSLDIKMPEFNGFEVLSLIRSHEHSRRAPSVPVIAITGNVSREDKALALASGFVAHVAKPVRMEALQTVLDRVEALRRDLYCTRYTVDQQSITDRLVTLLSTDSDTSQAVNGMALAFEQRGADLLRKALESFYFSDFQSAAEAAYRLADVGEAIGARHFVSLCESFAGMFANVDAFERQAVLVRAELDRIVFTLRERVLS